MISGVSSEEDDEDEPEHDTIMLRTHAQNNVLAKLFIIGLWAKGPDANGCI